PLGGDTYYSAIEPLVDPCSGQRLGRMVIQRGQSESRVFLRSVGQQLVLIVLSGLLAAALGSLALSAAITRPVHQLLEAVRRVAEEGSEGAVARGLMEACRRALSDPQCTARLMRHELIRLSRDETATPPAQDAPPAVYLVPIVQDRKLLGAMTCSSRSLAEFA